MVAKVRKVARVSLDAGPVHVCAVFKVNRRCSHRLIIKASSREELHEQGTESRKARTDNTDTINDVSSRAFREGCNGHARDFT